ncbi:hypothetical protein DFS33DRAFT_578601 [Desarmillaria ectypa]|nr:hypothetical protein DFS33DRAFT_578601 [Desarmillaria ectypa]
MAMEHAAMRSRDAFLILAGEISFLLALTLAKKEGEDWKIALIEEVGGNWTDLVRSSWLVQNDSGFWQGEEASRRVGLFVDPRACKDAAKFLEAYTAYSIPVWIDRGPITSPFEALTSSYARSTTFGSHRVRLFVVPQQSILLSKYATSRLVLVGGQACEIFVVSESEQNVLQRTTGYLDFPAANCSDDTRVTVEGHRCSEEVQLLHTPIYKKQSRHARTTELDPEEKKYLTGSVDAFVWEKVDNKEYVAMRHISDSNIPPRQRHSPLPIEKRSDFSQKAVSIQFDGF